MENTKQPILIDGRIIAKTIKEEIRKEVSDLLDAGKRPPHLVAVIVGEDGASLSYVASKEKQSKEVGFTSSVYRFPETITEKELLETLDFLNKDPEVDGYIVQLPLPKHISERKVLESINPAKDVDGFHPTNEGRMMIGLPSYIPATPYGIKKLLDRSNIETEGKHCVVLGRSNIVGTPISILMSRNSKKANCTVTMCHTGTKNMAEIVKQADIIIAAAGRPNTVTADMVKEGAVVIDVGVNRIPDDTKKSGFRLVGDVDFDDVKEIASYITPVPGGVGPMTIAMLMFNTLESAENTI